MLEQEYHHQQESTSEINYTDCDTTTSSNCLTTPFSVKDILNLNIPSSENGVNCGYQTSNTGYYPQYWENTCFNTNYDCHNFGYYGCGDVKNENFSTSVDAGFNCNNLYVPPVHQQPISGISFSCQGSDNKESESPSKHTFV